MCIKNIDTNTIANLFELCKEHLQCVVLNACYSEIQANEINKSIKYVIGMSQAIRDDAAIAFSTGFYRALGYGKSVEEAFKWGKNAIELGLNDGSKSKDVITESKRKLIPIDSVSKTHTIQEHLKPVLKVNLDLLQIRIPVVQQELEILTVGEHARLKTERDELQYQYDSLSEEIQFLQHSEKTDDLSPKGRFRLHKQIEQAKEERNKISNKLIKIEQKLQ